MKLLRYTFYVLGTLCFLSVVYYHAWFLRQPKRNIPDTENAILSPANGVVVGVKKFNEAYIQELKQQTGAIDVWTGDVDTAGYIISIQMDVTNVHYQRAPTNAKCLSRKYTSGSFKNAVVMNNELGIRFENEHNEILFEAKEGYRFKIVQIAGFLARRIEDYLQPGQQVLAGDVIGLIKLGSQVTVIVPSTMRPVSKIGEIVIDGETIIASK